jgi:hypothetical protein
MATFTATKIIHPTPALKVGVENAQVKDSSGIVIRPITYNEVKNSLGQQNYLVDGFYLYSENQNQLTSVIQYNSRNSTGNQQTTNVVTQIDPFQVVPSLLIDLKNFATNLILDGNSNIGTTVLGNTSLQMKFLAKRIGNSFGNNYNNFQMMQQSTRTKFFQDTYGAPLEAIKKKNKEIKKDLRVAIPETEPHHVDTLLTGGEEGKPLTMENGDVIYIKDGQPKWFTDEQIDITSNIGARQENDADVVLNPQKRPKKQPKKEPIKLFEPNHNQLPLFLLAVAAASYIMYKNSKK